MSLISIEGRKRFFFTFFLWKRKNLKWMTKNPIKPNIVVKKRLLIIGRINWSVERLFGGKQFKAKNIHRFDEFLLVWGNWATTEWFWPPLPHHPPPWLSSYFVGRYHGNRNRCNGRKDSNGEFMSTVHYQCCWHSLSFHQSKQPINCNNDGI